MALRLSDEVETTDDLDGDRGCEAADEANDAIEHMELFLEPMLDCEGVEGGVA